MAESPSTTDGRRSRGSRAARWLRRLAIAGGVAVALVAVVIAVLVGPSIRDDLALDRIVLAVALDWRDFGRDKAVERLQYELDHQGIGSQVGDDDCTLDELEGGERRVACAWTTEIRVPGSDAVIPLGFRSEARVDEDGELR